MNILVTGGAGFIGTALSAALQTGGHRVTLADLEPKFTRFHRDRFDCRCLDIREAANFQVLADASFDIIFHLAAQTSGAISQEQPELDVDTNVKGTLNVCNHARACGARKIVFTSSMAVYGQHAGAICETGALAPLSNYGASKVSAETFLGLFAQYGIRTTIFRLFNVYGPGQDMGNLRQGMASIFMAQAIRRTDIRVTGSLQRFRDFVYIDDVVAALLLAIDGLDDTLLNVGSGRQTTVRELIDAIFEIHEKPPSAFTVTDIGAHEGDPFGSVADITAIRKLGWKPQVGLHAGLAAMYAYAKEVLT